MATIQVRDVPEPVYEELRAQARANGQSLQAYMRGRIIDIVDRSDKQEAIEHFLAEAARRADGGAMTGRAVAELVRRDRDERTAAGGRARR